MRVVATIEARMRSTRLPGKVLLPILGRPMLELMVERLRRISRLDAIVIATTTDASCDPIEELANRLGVGCHRGSEDDVLDRVLRAAHSAQADVIVELTADCPLIDPDLTTQTIEAYLAGDADYVANCLREPYPRGMDVQVFSTATLEEVARLTDDPADHEHVSLYIYEHPERYRLREVPAGPPEAAGLRLTVDTPEDFALVSQIYEALYPSDPAFGLREIFALFARRPDLQEINAEIAQKPVR
jgi:spore coat polysaccharide biosynthesis protein SpsF